MIGYVYNPYYSPEIISRSNDISGISHYDCVCVVYVCAHVCVHVCVPLHKYPTSKWVFSHNKYLYLFCLFWRLVENFKWANAFEVAMKPSSEMQGYYKIFSPKGNHREVYFIKCCKYYVKFCTWQEFHEEGKNEMPSPLKAMTDWFQSVSRKHVLARGGMFWASCTCLLFRGSPKTCCWVSFHDYDLLNSGKWKWPTPVSLSGNHLLVIAAVSFY